MNNNKILLLPQYSNKHRFAISLDISKFWSGAAAPSVITVYPATETSEVLQQQHLARENSLSLCLGLS